MRESGVQVPSSAPNIHKEGEEMRLETKVILSQEDFDILEKARDIAGSIFRQTSVDSDLETFTERAKDNLNLLLDSCVVEE